ncbi:MAG: urease subunit gamma/beta [Chloroflexota bacterium]|nr:urease subunit gamma/beta [Chloroflexota bacterium]
MVAMRLTPWEKERLLVFAAAELARRHRSVGLLLNQPETVALICDAMLEAARAGLGYDDVVAAGRLAVFGDQVMPGVRELIDEVRLEVLFGDGTRLVVLIDPLAETGGLPGVDGPGAIRLANREAANDGPKSGLLELVVRSESQRVIRVSSHYPFHRVNRRLAFDRDAARGFRLDLPAGESQRWAPGETRTVRLVPYGGDPEGDG